mgnify:FL=1
MTSIRKIKRRHVIAARPLLRRSCRRSRIVTIFMEALMRQPRVIQGRYWAAIKAAGVTQVSHAKPEEDAKPA